MIGERGPVAKVAKAAMTDSGTKLPSTPGSTLGVIGGNAFWSLLRYGSSWLLLLIVPPFLIHHMSTGEYATWMLLLQFGSYLALFDANMQTAISRFVGRALGQQDRGYLASILSSVLVLLLFGAVMGAALSVAASWKLALLFPKIPVALMPRAQRGLLIIGGSLALTLPFTTLVGGFQGLQRNRVITIAVVVAKVVSSAGMIWAAAHHRSLVALALWFAVGAGLPPLFYVAEWLSSRDDLPFGSPSLPIVRELAGFYLLLVVTVLSTILIMGLDIPIVARFDFRAVGLYGLAAIFGNMLLIPQAAIVSAVMPAAAAKGASNDAAAVGAALHKFVRYANASLCTLTVGLSLVAPLFLRIWLGKALAAQVLPLALALLAAQAITLTVHPFRIMVLGVGQQARTLPAQLTEALVNVVCSVLLARHVGAIGVALGTVIGSCAAVIAQFMLSMPRTDRIVVSRRVYAASSLWQPAIACLPAMVLLLLLWRLHWNLLASAVFTVLGVLGTLALFWTRNFTTPEREHIVDLVKRRLRMA